MYTPEQEPHPSTSNGVAGAVEEGTRDSEAPVEEEAPAMSRTIVLTAHGGLDKLVVQDKPRRKPGNGEVLVKVSFKAVSMNLKQVFLKLATGGLTPNHQSTSGGRLTQSSLLSMC